jgi:hypothetical protein
MSLSVCIEVAEFEELGDIFRKGNYIPQEIIEAYTNVQYVDTVPGAQVYSFAQLGFKGQLERSILKHQDHRVYVKFEGRGLRILTDSEAIPEATKRHQAALKALRANTRKAADIVLDTVDPDTIQQFENEQRKRGYQMDALSRALRKPSADDLLL